MWCNMGKVNSLRSYWQKNGKLFLSFFAVAAFLPVVLLGAVSKDGFKLLTQADEETPLRIWFEPGSVVARPGDKFKLKIVSEYDDKNKLIPKISLMTKGGSGVVVMPEMVSYNSPFVGKTVLGEVMVEVTEPGTTSVEILENSINTTLPNLPVVTTEAQISVKNK